MMKTGFKELAKTSRRFVVKNAPTIFTTLGSIGVVGTTIIGIKATPRALMSLEEEFYTLNPDVETALEIPDIVSKFTPLEITRICWRHYAPTAAIGIASIACIIGANSINLKRQAVLAGLYATANKDLKQYKNKVEEVLGVKNKDKVEEAVATENVQNYSDNNVINNGVGNTLFFDKPSGRFFRHDMNLVKKAEIGVQSRAINEAFSCINDFYFELGLPETSLGDYLGWSMGEHGTAPTLKITPVLNQNDEACMQLDWDVFPSYDG